MNADLKSKIANLVNDLDMGDAAKMNLRAEIRFLVREAEQAMQERAALRLRCQFTGNPCGTDTVPLGSLPDCDMCRAAAAIRALDSL